MSDILTVARLELTVRIRAGRWRWLLGGWFVILFFFQLLLRVALGRAHDLNGSRGTVLYGSLQLFQLALALLVVPALTSQSVNGDREKGTLAVLQVTNLSAFDIAAGKLLAAWGTACVFLLVSAPLVVWSMVEGGVPVIRVVVVTIVVALLLGVVCAISLGLSAVLARSTTSSVLSYLCVFALTVGTLVLFGLSTAVTATTSGVHTERTWWLLAPNPFVVLADAAPVAPLPPEKCRTVTGGSLSGSVSTPGAFRTTVELCTPGPSVVDPLGSISRYVRSLRAAPGPAAVVGSETPLVIGPDPPSPVGGLIWPYGLGFDLVLGALMFLVTTRQLRTPRRVLPRGVRLG